MDTHLTPSLIRLEGEFTVTCAAELKTNLLAWLASGGDLHLDLEHLAEADITLLQLLVAAAREGAGTGAGITARVSAAVDLVARDAGFDRFPVPVEPS